MTIEKKSLISTLKATKKANVAKEDLTHGGTTSSVKSPARILGSKNNLTGKKHSVAGSKNRVAGEKMRFTGKR
jgi:hypothetical protein